MHAVHADLADAAVLLVEHGADLTAKSKVKEGSSAVPDQIRVGCCWLPHTYLHALSFCLWV